MEGKGWFGLVWFNGISNIVGYLMVGWFGFYGISTIVGYLMPNPFYTYILK